MSKEVLFEGVAPVGADIYFWHKADMSVLPLVGKVVAAYRGGVVDVIVCGAYSADMIRKLTVSHVSSPRLKDEKGLPTVTARDYGCWDFVPWFPINYQDVTPSAKFVVN